MNRPLLSIVSPFFNEAEGAQLFCKKILEIFDSMPGYDWELICVDDGSSDLTLAKLNECSETDRRIRIFGFSRNFGHQAALFAGLENVSRQSSAVVVMDSDFQHPPDLLPVLVAQWEQGFEVVSTIRKKQMDSGRLKRATSALYYRLLSSIADIPVTSGAADFCLLDAKALGAVLQFEERSPFLRGIIAWIGFNRTFVAFDAPSRMVGVSKYSFAKMLRLAADGIFSFSVSPMRVSLKIGSTVSLLAMTYLLYAVAVFATHGAVRGWTSLLAVVIFFGGLNLISIGLIGEYLGRTFQEVKRRPRYILRQRSRDSAADLEDRDHAFMPSASRMTHTGLTTPATTNLMPRRATDKRETVRS